MVGDGGKGVAIAREWLSQGSANGKEVAANGKEVAANGNGGNGVRKLQHPLQLQYTIV